MEEEGTVWLANNTCFPRKEQCENESCPSDRDEAHCCVECPNPWGSHARAEILSEVGFWLSGVLFITLGSFGVIGNYASILVLTRDKKIVSSVNRLLIVLSYFDIFYISICLLEHGLIFIDVHFLQNDHEGLGTSIYELFCTNKEPVQSLFYIYMYPHIIYPFKHIFQTCSIYMTMAISLDRYLAIVHPYSFYQQRRSSVVSDILLGSGNKKVKIYSTIVFAFSLLFNSVRYAGGHLKTEGKIKL